MEQDTVSSGSQTCPEGTPTLHFFFISLIKHTWFNSSAHYHMG